MYEGEDIEDEPIMDDESMNYWETPEGIAESTRQLKAFFAERQSQDEIDLPEHKRSGYAEKMAEQGDLLRKERKENGR